MLYSVPLFSKKFEAVSSQKAFIKAANWLHNNVVSENDMQDCMYSIVRDSSGEYPCYILKLFVYLDDTDEFSKFCKICKSYHKSFFINEEYNCSRCNAITYNNRLKDKAKIRKSFKKEKLKEILKE